ncbi:hypothetical protein QBZ16_001052 [Prototheca wickerhamii]|uniref:CBS domain-containing protein n=1 Tax=Prototheca wickerhamii TaxID=3111 RepID=A0AAD9IFE1_PROWI|nr:hypothetical protein QBZ16_001052 [Prototheca wickerhamii]
MEALGDDVLSEAKAMLRRMRLLEERGVEFSQTPLHALKSFGSDGLVFPAAEAASWPLDRVLRQGFLRPHSARAGAPSPTHVTHRLGLCDERGEVRAVVTQTDVARWLDRALDALPELAAASARDLGLGTGGLIGVRPDTPALEALGLMRSSGVSAVVVRDADGGLVGNFSASDMRSILAEHFGALALPVGEFLAREHGTEYAGYAVQSEEEGDARAKNLEFLERRSSRPGYEVGQDLVTCILKHVVEKLVKNGLHRLYVVDDELKPTGVITLTDILSRVCLEPEQAEA